MGASKVELEIYRAGRARGLKPVAVAGMIGNAAQESSLDPTVNQFGLYQTSGYGSTSQLSVAEQTDFAIEHMGSALVDAMNNAKTPAEAARLMEIEFEKPAGSQPGESASTNNRPHREAAAEAAFKNLTGLVGGGTQSGEEAFTLPGQEAFEGIFGGSVNHPGELTQGAREATKATEATGELAETVLKWLKEPTRLLKLVGGAALLYMGVHALTQGTPAEPIANVPGKAVQAVAGVVPGDAQEKAVKLARKHAKRAHAKARTMRKMPAQKGSS